MEQRDPQGWEDGGASEVADAGACSNAQPGLSTNARLPPAGLPSSDGGGLLRPAADATEPRPHQVGEALCARPIPSSSLSALRDDAAKAAALLIGNYPSTAAAAQPPRPARSGGPAGASTDLLAVRATTASVAAGLSDPPRSARAPRVDPEDKRNGVPSEILAVATQLYLLLQARAWKGQRPAGACCCRQDATPVSRMSHLSC